MKYWAPILHFYQPPTQERGITWNILTFCYLPLLRMLDKKSRYGLTMNISGCLLTQLDAIGAKEFFHLVKKLVREGKVELVGSVADHPLIPITPADVVARQVKTNQQLLHDLLGVKKVEGFFPPELAVDEKSFGAVPGKYVVVDEHATGGIGPIVKYGKQLLVVNNRNICEVLRSYPNELRGTTVADMMTGVLTVTANDAELFGHHYVERLQVLAELIDDERVKCMTVSAAIDRFGSAAPTVAHVETSTWQNMKNFDLWTGNELQKKYLKLLATVHGLDYASKQYDLATSSCYLYWLSNWPWWHPGFVEKGAENIVASVNDTSVKELYDDFIKSMWHYHNSGAVEKMYEKYNEEKKSATK